MHAAAFLGHVSLVQLLLRYSAVPDICDTDGETALSWAAAQGHAEVEKLLQVRRHASLTRACALRALAFVWPDLPRALVCACRPVFRCRRVVGCSCKQVQQFAPQVVQGLLTTEEVARLYALRSLVTPVHDDGAGHEVVFLHASQAAGQLSAECDALFARMVEAMRTHDPRGPDLSLDLAVRDLPCPEP